ncbi:MAG: hypothetical protein DRJ59_06325 [Thermoprotei archaeon]|nr:MAG: hypothetical protein DRJ59_06325 [Thermoprotei archaeon]
MIIDIHVHLGSIRSFYSLIRGWVTVYIEDLLGYMDEVGVQKAVVLSVPRKDDPDSRVVSNEELLRTVQEYEDRLIPFCVLDPRENNLGDRLSRLVKLGCRGIGEFKVRLPADDDSVVKFLKMVSDYGLPVLFHMEEGEYFYDVFRLRKVLEKFPDMAFIGHGPGWWRHISKQPPSKESYPKGPITEEGMIQKLLREYENIYADISAYSGLNALARDPEYSKKFLSEFQDRVLFGTDFPCLSITGSQFGVNREHLNFLHKLGISSEILERILHLNAEKILFRK